MAAGGDRPAAAPPAAGGHRGSPAALPVPAAGRGGRQRGVPGAGAGGSVGDPLEG